MTRPGFLALALFPALLTACGPRVQTLPPPAGGYPTLVPNRTVSVTLARGAVVQLPAGTRLTANRSIRGQTVYCGPAYADDVTARLCVARRYNANGEDCLSANTTGPLACFPRGTFTEGVAPDVTADDVAAEMDMGFDD